MQILLLSASKGTEVSTKRSPGPLTGSAVDLASAITLLIPRPFAHTMSNRGMGRMAAAIALPCVGIEQGAAWGHMVGKKGVAGLPVRVVTDPAALLACVTRDAADDGRPIVGRGAVPLALIGAPAGSRGGVLFCPRVLVELISLTGGAGGCGAVCVPTPARARGAPSARLGPHPAAAVPGWPAVAGSWRRPSPSAASSNHRRPDHGRRESGPGHGPSVAPRFGTGGSAGRLGAGAAPATIDPYIGTSGPKWSLIHFIKVCRVSWPIDPSPSDGGADAQL
jgi:hypothetical protein